MDTLKEDLIDDIMELTKMYEITDDTTDKPITKRQLKKKTRQELIKIYNDTMKEMNRDIKRAIKKKIIEKQNKIRTEIVKKIKRLWRDKK